MDGHTHQGDSTTESPEVRAMMMSGEQAEKGDEIVEVRIAAPEVSLS
jgi:hypothetical protein